MSDRHEKWTRVEPGTVIPAGQPYRVETPRYHQTASEFCDPTAWTAVENTFVDSSWKPPLDLPTEPTWGIAVCPKPGGMVGNIHDESFAEVGRYAVYEAGILTRTNRDYQTRFDRFDVSFVTDFIPLTPEQVARLEQAR